MGECVMKLLVDVIVLVDGVVPFVNLNLNLYAPIAIQIAIIMDIVILELENVFVVQDTMDLPVHYQQILDYLVPLRFA